MYYMLSLLSGLLISVMVLFNGMLAGQYGVHLSTAIIFFTGLLLIAAIVLAKRERPFGKRHSWFLYIGGAIGVLTIIFNNVAFGRISVSALLALVLLGQSVSGLVIDQFGWLDMPKHPFKKQRVVGLLLTVAGIALMIDRFDAIPVLLSFSAGCTIVLSRTLNAKLGALTSVTISTFFNYLVGFTVSVPVFVAFSASGMDFAGLEISPNPMIYLGGFLGVCVIAISNIVVTKIPAFYLSLVLFIGQVFTGIIIDAIIARSFSIPILLGGILVTVGLCVDLLLDRRNN